MNEKIAEMLAENLSFTKDSTTYILRGNNRVEAYSDGKDLPGGGTWSVARDNEGWAIYVKNTKMGTITASLKDTNGDIMPL